MIKVSEFMKTKLASWKWSGLLVIMERYQPSTSKLAEQETCPDGLEAVTSTVPTSSGVTLSSRSTCVCWSTSSVMIHRSLCVNLWPFRYHVTSGYGSPLTLHVNVTSWPSLTYSKHTSVDPNWFTINNRWLRCLLKKRTVEHVIV